MLMLKLALTLWSHEVLSRRELYNSYDSNCRHDDCRDGDGVCLQAAEFE